MQTVHFDTGKKKELNSINCVPSTFNFCGRTYQYSECFRGFRLGKWFMSTAASNRHRPLPSYNLKRRHLQRTSAQIENHTLSQVAHPVPAFAGFLQCCPGRLSNFTGKRTQPSQPVCHPSARSPIRIIQASFFETRRKRARCAMELGPPREGQFGLEWAQETAGASRRHRCIPCSFKECNRDAVVV